MSSLFETMGQFFDDDGWSYSQVEGQPVLQLGFQGDNGQWFCYAQAREEEAQFVFYSVFPNNVPEAQIPTFAELLTRANYGLIIGNFEMDYGDGEVRYKTSIDVEGDELSTALVRQAVYANVMVMDGYMPSLNAVLFGDVSPADAVSQMEG